MDRLWSPWRYQYVSRGSSAPASDCIFCEKAADPSRDAENFVLFRGEFNYALLNIYPYTNGHLMIAPYTHVGTLSDSTEAALEEMMRLTRTAEMKLREVYRAPGLNIGMNLGECAGAGVAGHIHMHVLPRWPADSNFMTTIGESRVIPEAIEETWHRLRF
jgi:ATP adenylyltransferase